jgi:cyclic-di-GMP-binding protein
MASEHSFDVVSKLDLQEVRNAVDQAMKEIGQRFDFKGSVSRITLEADHIALASDDPGKLQSVVRVLEERLVRRGLSLKALDYGAVESAAGGTVRQRATLVQGIASDKARAIVASIKGLKTKVQAAIQGDQVRVSGKKLDELQGVIAHLKAQDFGVPLQFENYR